MMTFHAPSTESRPAVRQPRITWALCVIITRLIVRLRMQGREHLLQPGAGPYVVACRHISWIDPLIIVRVLGPNRPVVFLAAREHVERRAALNYLLRWLGAVILVERGAQHQRDILRAAQQALDAGASLALFPEGRINVVAETGVAILPLEPGAAVIARRAGVPVLPLSIAGSDGLHVGRRVVITVGEPLPPGSSRRDDEQVTGMLRERLLAITPPAPPPSRWQPGRWLSRLS
jgi:1-acyl-sn-glycerol-3-phosphate acyltransferase